MELVVNYARLNGCTDSCTIEQLQKWTCAFIIFVWAKWDAGNQTVPPAFGDTI